MPASLFIQGSSEKFRRLLDDISSRFDRVVLDSPPVIAVTDSAIVSTLVDGVVFVVRAFKTSVNLCKSGLRTLRDVEAPIAGAVLNAVNLNRHEYNYYHYYYYKREGYAPLAGTVAASTPATGNDDDRGRPAAPPN